MCPLVLLRVLFLTGAIILQGLATLLAQTQTSSETPQTIEYAKHVMRTVLRVLELQSRVQAATLLFILVVPVAQQHVLHPFGEIMELGPVQQPAPTLMSSVTSQIIEFARVVTPLVLLVQEVHLLVQVVAALDTSVEAAVLELV